MDLGLAGDTYFVNVVSVGLGAAAIPAVSPTLKRLAGALAYPVAAARALRRGRPFAAMLTFPDSDYPAATFPRLLQVGVGNGRFYGGGIVVAPQAGLDEGLLDVYALTWGSWRNLLGVARSFKSGAFVHRSGVHHYRTALDKQGAESPRRYHKGHDTSQDSRAGVEQAQRGGVPRAGSPQTPAHAALQRQLDARAAYIVDGASHRPLICTCEHGKRGLQCVQVRHTPTRYT